MKRIFNPVAVCVQIDFTVYVLEELGRKIAMENGDDASNRLYKLEGREREGLSGVNLCFPPGQRGTTRATSAFLRSHRWDCGCSSALLNPLVRRHAYYCP